MILVIDNYDSFTFNLVQSLRGLVEEVMVVRNDQIEVAAVRNLHVDAIVISPGPGRPEDAGICRVLIGELSGAIPILGVCLGHQAIATAFGGQVVRADRLMHGKTSLVSHDGRTLFAELDNPFEAMRYHSLVVERATVPACFEISAWTEDGEIMALRHRSLPLEGVQFHPESFMTAAGDDLLRNFVRIYVDGNKAAAQQVDRA